MSTEQTTTPFRTDSFQHKSKESDCSCPIHRNQDRNPFTAPLGLPFADHVHIEPIPQTWAKEIYEAHHGYMGGNDLHNACFDHHGLYYQNQLMGAITWRFPPFSRKKICLDKRDNIIQEPYTDSDFEDLPNEIQKRARLLLGETSEDDVNSRPVLHGDRFAEANRICIGERMANLASCSLAASQEYFVESPECPDKVDYLITFVRADFRGSMLRALRDKGWECIGISEPKQASNRDYKEIRDRYKWVFVCSVERVQKQAALSQWIKTENSQAAVP